MDITKHLLFLTLLSLLSSCATSNHGNFIASSYDAGIEKDNEILGKVTGISKQTWFLYMFPTGKAPSTDKAISNAKTKYEGTEFLTDISIDDRIHWKLGYREQVIEVKATAHK